MPPPASFAHRPKSCRRTPRATPVRRRAPLPAAVGCCLLLAACTTPGDADLAGRCAELVQEALPAGAVTLTGERAFDDAAPNFDTIIARVQGVEHDAPGEPAGRRVAAQCRFYNGILTRFRWAHAPLAAPPVGSADRRSRPSHLAGRTHIT